MGIKSKIEEIYEILYSETMEEIGLLSGFGGQIVSCANYQKINQKQSSYIFDLLEVLENKLSNESFIYSHCSGLAGIGWMYEYLHSIGIIQDDTNELLADFDIILGKKLKIEMSTGNYDFLHGGVGMALYFVKRISKNPNLLPILNQFLHALYKIKEIEKENLCKWKSIIDHKTQEVGYNISLSHGSSSVVCLLSKIYQLDNFGENKKEIRRLLKSSIEYILNQQIDKEQYNCYFASMSIESDKTLHQSRLGWCYGDLSIATTLYQAGNILNKQSWIDKAIEILLYTAENRKSLAGNKVLDAGLCHGTAGIGHIFYRMWWNTKMPEFKKAADYWFKQTLKIANFEDGLAGFKAWHSIEYGGWVNAYGLLEGIAGIGLALLTYYYELEPTWDECLFLS